MKLSTFNVKKNEILNIKCQKMKLATKYDAPQNLKVWEKLEYIFQKDCTVKR